MDGIREFGTRLWTLDGPTVRMMTIPFPTRMTIAKLDSGGLWVHSPIPPTDAHRTAVDAVGRVEHLVAPNRIHSLGIEPWKARYPGACVWVSPRFRERHPDIAADRVLDNDPPGEWSAEIDQHAFAGSRFLDEVVFFHRPSKTLIVTDLIQRHDPASETFFWRLTKRAVGVVGERGGTARDLRLTFTDRKAARRSAETVLAWDFERVVISHGMCIRENARELVERALFAWL